MSDAAALARWLLALEIAGWGLYPLLYLAVPALRDRGLTVAKPFALLLLTYPAWLLAALGAPVFTAPTLLATLLLFSLAGWGLAIRPPGPPILGGESSGTLPLSPRGRAAGVIPFLRANWRYALAAEALFVAAFLAYAWLRGYTPQILGTEKPMEIGFLAAATRQAAMPPGDPWLSGYGINYYYLGYVVVAAVAKLTAVSSSIAFNLGLATVFAATLTGGTGLVANLLPMRSAECGVRNGTEDGHHGDTKGPSPFAPRHANPRHDSALRIPHSALVGGLIGGYLLALAGNMYAARDILGRGRAALDTWWWGGLGWKSSRVVVDSGFPAAIFGPNARPSETITEFPFFSFILGDLHAHVLALPFTVLALALALDAWLASPVAPRSRGERGGATRVAPPGIGRGGGRNLYRLGIAALVIGALYALNSWDLPTYAALYLAALLLPPTLWRGGAGRGEWLAAAGFALLCVALYAPFWAGFTSLVGGRPFELPEPWRSVPGLSRISAVLGVVIWGKTPAGQFFTVYLLPYVVGIIFLAWLWRRGRAARGDWTTPLLAVLALALGATLLRMPVFFLAGLLVALAAAVLRRPGAADTDRFVTLLFGAAFALVLATEVFFVHDVFGNRMNTVFKVYYQAWTLLAIGAGYAVARAIFDRRRWRAEGGWRAPAAAAATLLLLASAAYPLAGSWARTEGLAARRPLDGLAFVGARLPEEEAGIRWVRAHVPAGAVVAEAPGCSYGELDGLPHNRVSAFAGVSTPLGWGGHEQQWRAGSPELLAGLGPRGADVNALYGTTDPAEAARILDRYGIDYVYVGVFERTGYAAGGIGADCRAGGGYPAAGLAKFDAMLERVFQSERGLVTIYRRR